MGRNTKNCIELKTMLSLVKNVQKYKKLRNNTQLMFYKFLIDTFCQKIFHFLAQNKINYYLYRKIY